MTTPKPKRKNAPRRRGFYAKVVLLATLILLIMAIAIPYAEQALQIWLKDDPFTPMCHDEHLEIAFTSNVEGDTYIYRMRLNGESPQRVTDDTDPRATLFEWTPDGEYLIFRMSNTLHGQLNFVDARTGQITPLEIEEGYESYYYMPDHSAMIVEVKYVEGDPVYLINFPITESTIAEKIGNIPQLFFLPENRHLYSWYSDFNRAHHNQIASADGSWIVSAEQTLQRAGINKQNHIFVKDASTYQIVWEIGHDQTEYDVEHVIQDISLSNELLYFRRYFRIGENSVTLDMSDEVFIADMESQTLTPILEDRPGNRIRQLVWSPDNRWMVVSLENWDIRAVDTYLANFDGTDLTLVRSMPFDNFSSGQFQWTPDGQYLSFTASNDWIYLLDLETRQPCRVAKGNSDWSTNYDWRLLDG